MEVPVAGQKTHNLVEWIEHDLLWMQSQISVVSWLPGTHVPDFSLEKEIRIVSSY